MVPFAPSSASPQPRLRRPSALASKLSVYHMRCLLDPSHRCARLRILLPLAVAALSLAACTSIVASPQSLGSGLGVRSRADLPGDQVSPAERSTAPAGFDPAPQTSEAGSVTVEVTWGATGAGAPTFAVSLETHSVDLDGYDLRQLALLRTDQDIEAHPTGWEAPKGGHHRSGTLTFPAAAADGRPLVGPATQRVELLIHDVAGVLERRFEWTR